MASVFSSYVAVAVLAVVALLLAVPVPGALARLNVAPDLTAGACSTCMAVVRVLDDLMCDEEIAVKAIEFTEQNVCPLLGVDQDTCMQLAVQLVPLAIDWLRSEATPAQLCSSAGVCGTEDRPQLAITGSKNNNPLRSRLLRDGLDCPMCHQLVSLLQPLAQSPPDQILATAQQACDGLPAQMAPWCHQWVQERASLLPAAVSVHTGVDFSCVALGSCRSALAGAAPPPLPASLVKLLGALQGLWSRRHTAPVAKTSSARHFLGGGDNGNTCDICRLSVTELHTLVSNPQVQDDVTAYLEALCAKLGAPAADQCRSYVDLYLPLVYATIQEQLQDSAAICTGLHMCVPMEPPTAAVVVSRLQLPWRNGDASMRKLRASRH